MSGCLRIFRLKRSILLVNWSIILHLYLLIVKLLVRYGLVLLAEYSVIKTLGSLAYCNMKDGKLEPMSNKCISSGYADRVK